MTILSQPKKLWEMKVDRGLALSARQVVPHRLFLETKIHMEGKEVVELDRGNLSEE